ncbi:hypothetical protein [Methylobacterium brachythecii]|nr:hypothetical protein [Methylobacterium brachythecii]GLS44378.1 hypothetical protein GCM10007884_23660 [Methylobacterium brachythecii]
MTDEQRARVPGILREIIDLDRKIGAFRDRVAAAPVLPMKIGNEARRLRRLRDELTAGARQLYGRAPLRGDTGPGRPTAVAA